MKYNHQTLFLGMCLGLSLLAANVPAYAQQRQTTAFSAFHIRAPLDPTHNPYACVTESYGALQNQCSYEVDVMFDMPAETSSTHYVWAQNFVHGTGSTGATCSLWTYDGNGNGRLGTVFTFPARGVFYALFYPAVSGNNFSLLCNLPSGEGISSVYWIP
jgi:hypothetical protein